MLNTYFKPKPLPDFLTKKERLRFEGHKEVKFFIPDNVPLRNVWLTYSGICFTYFRIYKGSIYWKAYSKYQYFLLGLVNLFKKKKVYISGESFFIHTPWSVINYHHWLVDSIPRLYALTKERESFTLILPEALKEVQFAMESISVFWKGDLRFMQKDEVYHLEKSILTNISPGEFYISSDLLPAVSVIKSKLCKPSARKRKVYLTRRNVGYRALVNEEEVCKMLSENGFEIIEADKFSFREQVQLFSDTKILIGIHGAALTNCMFMEEGSSVIELHPDIEREGSIINVCYQNLCSCFNLHYSFIGCLPENIEERFHTANLIVDMDKLERILSTVLPDSFY